MFVKTVSNPRIYEMSERELETCYFAGQILVNNQYPFFYFNLNIIIIGLEYW